MQGSSMLVPHIVTNKNTVSGFDVVPTSDMAKLPLKLWLFEMQPMGPGTLGYRHEPWMLITSDMVCLVPPPLKPFFYIFPLVQQLHAILLFLENRSAYHDREYQSPHLLCPHTAILHLPH
jgi:hypothetical protein